MIVYTVHEPPEPPADRLDRAEALMFVKDGFSPMVALLAPLWMAGHGLWLVLVGYLAAVAVLALAFNVMEVAGSWTGLALVALHVALGFEASSLRRWTLERRGWRFLATVAGRSAEECERRFFDDWLPGQPFLDGKRLQAGAAPFSAPQTRSWWRLGAKG